MEITSTVAAAFTPMVVAASIMVVAAAGAAGRFR